MVFVSPDCRSVKTEVQQSGSIHEGTSIGPSQGQRTEEEDWEEILLPQQ